MLERRARPCAMRPAIRTVMLPAKPQISEAAVNRAKPLMKIRFAPKRSPRAPAVNNRLAKTSV